MNSSNVNFAPTFNFSSSLPPGTFSDSNTITIPAGARNYPVILWCKVATGSNTVSFESTLEISGLPSSQITITGNIARY